jgi:hypothetical protein
MTTTPTPAALPVPPAPAVLAPPPLLSFHALRAIGLIYCEVGVAGSALTAHAIGWITRASFLVPYSAWYCDGHRKAAATTLSFKGARGWLLEQAGKPSPALPADQSVAGRIARREANWRTQPKFSVLVRTAPKFSGPPRLIRQTVKQVIEEKP